MEKVYCVDRNDGTNNLLASMLAGKGDNNALLTAAMANGGGFGGFNNPWAYIMFMMMIWRMWGNNGGIDSNGNAAALDIQNQINSLRSQLSDNQNSNLLMDAIKGNSVALGQLSSTLNCDFNTLQQCCCSLQAAVQQVGGQLGFSDERVINAVDKGDCGVIQAIRDCCCTTQKSILEMGYQSQLQNCQQTNTIMTGINTLNTGLERGFSNVAYQSQAQTCQLIDAGERNTQRIIDTMNQHWNQELQLKYQDAKLELSQQAQNAYLISQLKTTTA